MSTYILILWLAVLANTTAPGTEPTGRIYSIRFWSMEHCQAALTSIKRGGSDLNGMCVKI